MVRAPLGILLYLLRRDGVEVQSGFSQQALQLALDKHLAIEEMNLALCMSGEA
jgi:hypothetical protein